MKIDSRLEELELLEEEIKQLLAQLQDTETTSIHLKTVYQPELYASQEFIRILKASEYNTSVRTTNSLYQASNKRNGQSANLGTPTSSNTSSSQNSEVTTEANMPLH